MRLGGSGNWMYLTRRALALACAMLLVAAASAVAAPRYAVPTGGLGAGACGVGSECTIERAFAASGSGDTVHIAAGTYNPSGPLSGGAITVQGTTGVRIVGGAGFGSPTLTLGSGATVRDVRVESTSSQPALSLNGTGNRLRVFATGGDALALAGGSTLENSVVHTSDSGGTAVRVSAGLLATTTIVHSTIVATGSGSTGLDSAGLAVSGRHALIEDSAP